MHRRTFARAALALLIAAALSLAYVIVAKNNAAMNPMGRDIPSGFLH